METTAYEILNTLLVKVYDDPSDDDSDYHWEQTDAKLYSDHYILNGKEYKADCRTWETYMGNETTVHFDYYNLHNEGPYKRSFKSVF